MRLKRSITGIFAFLIFAIMSTSTVVFGNTLNSNTTTTTYVPIGQSDTNLTPAERIQEVRDLAQQRLEYVRELKKSTITSGTLLYEIPAGLGVNESKVYVDENNDVITITSVSETVDDSLANTLDSNTTTTTYVPTGRSDTNLTPAERIKEERDKAQQHLEYVREMKKSTLTNAKLYYEIPAGLGVNESKVYVDENNDIITITCVSEAVDDSLARGTSRTKSKTYNVTHGSKIVCKVDLTCSYYDSGEQGSITNLRGVYKDVASGYSAKWDTSMNYAAKWYHYIVLDVSSSSDTWSFLYSVSYFPYDNNLNVMSEADLTFDGYRM